jgi:putative endonuclease
VLERNWRCRSGEIDVIARDGDVTVFVEVKQRASGSHGAGHEAVTWRKRQRIVRAARLFSLARGLEGRPLRFDVISIDPGEAGEPRLRHDEDAFDGEGR